jgi:hypothetical protein
MIVWIVAVAGLMKIARAVERPFKQGAPQT